MFFKNFFALLIAMNLVHTQDAIRVVTSGKCKTVLFLPGYTTRGIAWNETIENLKGKNEQLIMMMALNELQYEEITKVIGISAVNVRVKIHRIKERF